MKQNNFNFLRFYFAFIVVIGHLIVISGARSFQNFGPYFSTYISVTSFFCISGFLITQSYLNTKSLKTYFSKRAARLLPAYLLVIILSIVLLSFLSKYSFSEYFTHPQLFKYIFANLSFLNFIQPCLPGVFSSNNLACDVNGALWTLKVEVCFYLTIPIILHFAEKIQRKYIFFIAIYILSIFYKDILEYLSDTLHNNFYSMLARQLPGFLSYFVSGIACYYYFDFFSRNKRFIFILALIIYLAERKFGLEILTPITLSAIIFTIAFSIKQLNSFGKHGDISYGIYIFHCPIIKVVTYFGLFEKFNPFLVGLFVILLVLITGFASWHVVEKRFIKRTHKI